VREERRMILKMLEDGKINASEAAELLRALGEHAGPEAGEEAEWEVDWEGPDEEETHRPRRRRPRRHVGSVAQEVAEAIGSTLSALPTAIWGRAYEFDEVVEGEFEKGEGPVEIDVSTHNGRVEVQAWDRPGYRVELLKRLRAEDEDEARRRADKLVSVQRKARGLAVRSREDLFGSSGVAVSVLVPRDETCSVRLSTANGRVAVRGVKGSGIEARTANGRVELERIAAPAVNVRTANGRIVVEGEFSDLEASTTNGSISVAPEPAKRGRYLLRASSGSIRVRLPEDAEVGYEIEATTTFGGIDIDVPDLEYLREEKRFGRGYVRARTKGIGDQDSVLRVDATTSSGRIAVGPHA